MSLRDRIRDAAINAATGGQGEPAAARRATQAATLAARLATDAGHPGIAAAAAVAAALVVAADDLAGHPSADGDDYATFKDRS